MKLEISTSANKTKNAFTNLAEQEEQNEHLHSNEPEKRKHLSLSLLEEGVTEGQTNHLSPTSLETLRKEFKLALCRDKDTEELITVLAENNG